MSHPPTPAKWPADRIQVAADLISKLGTAKEAARVLGETESAVRGALHKARISIRDLVATPQVPDVSADAVLRDRLEDLRRENAELQRRVLTDDRVRREILRLAASEAKVPGWALRPRGKASSPGVPSLFIGDWHWGEVVDPAQIGGVNSYDLDTARRRARTCVENAIDLVLRHTVNPECPGLVLAIGGDMLSGDIHEELSATNEQEWGPVFLDLQGVLTWGLDTLAKELGRLFVVAVTGNHPRTSKKPRAKGRNHTNFDWLLYQQLRRRFEGDKRIAFLVPDSSDALYSVAGHRYMLTHGDAYRGGDGIIGSIGPVFRGDVRTRARNAQIGASYDTSLVAHFHEYRAERRRIQNGSLVGYNEYAYQRRFPYEPPIQALWWTHEAYGPTIHLPVFVEKQPRKAAPWVAWEGRAA